MQGYPWPPISYAAKAAESFLANDADDWNLVKAKKQSKFPAHNVDRETKATIPELYPPISTLDESEAYYIKYSTIMKHLVKAGDNPDMSEEHVVGMMNNILQEFAPQIKAMCLSMVGNRPTGKGLNLRMSRMIGFIGLVDNMKATYPTKSNDDLQAIIFTELGNMFQQIFKHKLLNGLTDSSTVSTMTKFIVCLY